MCGRVRLSSDYSEIKIGLKFDANAPAPNFEADWNLPPTRPMLVAIRSLDGARIPKMMKWGLLPHWSKDDKSPTARSMPAQKSSLASPRSATLGDEVTAAWS
jgi:putative SOS response-associated peptidase YedK